jgi:galactokinase
MYSIQYGSSHNLPDTAAFINLLGSLPGHLSGQWRGLFSPDRELIVTRAPGRLDLMGGIADYSGSLVLQLPIAGATHAALQRQEEATLHIVSLSAGSNLHFEGPARVFEMPLSQFHSSGQPIDYADACARFKTRTEEHWAAYVAGAFLVLMRENGLRFTQGARILLSSNVPEGKGVSSSAALEVAAMQAIAAAYEIEISPRGLAFLCQKVENRIAGAPCGVMDQMTSACGEADRLLALLCQPGEVIGTLKLPDELAVWGIDSGIRHSVGGPRGDTDYGTVRTAAFMGYRIIAEIAGLACRANGARGQVEIDDWRWKGYLANITPAEFIASFASHLPQNMLGEDFLKRYNGIADSVSSVIPERTYPVYQATKHPIYEHERVKKFAQILGNRPQSGQAEQLGELMYQAHESYSACGLGSSGTDEIVRIVRELGPDRGLYGAKITGGGSGGTVAVLGDRYAGAQVKAVAETYACSTGYQPLVISGSSPGASRFGHLVIVTDWRTNQGE